MYNKKKLEELNITKLKLLAKELKVPGYTAMRASDKDKLIELILQQPKPIQQQPKPIQQQPKPIQQQPKPIQQQPKPIQQQPKPPQQQPTVQKTPVGPPTHVETNNKIAKKEYIFDRNVIPDVSLKLKKYIPGESKDIVFDNDEITPEILLDKLKDNDFMTKIITTLYNLYRTKDKKYTELEIKVKKSIDLDIEEMEAMAQVIDRREAEKMFPLIPVNQALLVKIRKLRTLCKTAIEQYKNINNATITKVRNNFKDAITNDDIGIVSVSGERRKNIRNQLCKTLFILSKGYKPFTDSFINIVFTGPAGVGKTKLANTVGYVYAKSGILLIGEVIIVSPKDMIGEYIGQTAPKTAGILMKGLESIIFIDEAYQIMPCDKGEIIKGTKSFGPEAITEIVNFLDKYIGLSIMIVAGYEREIQGCFFEANEGLPRRFPIRYNLPPYSIESLLNIFLNDVNKRLGKEIFTKDIVNYIYALMVKLNNLDKDIFKNQAGDMLNLVTMFLTVYYGSNNINWGTIDNNKIIINNTFNLFLRNKGYQMET
jgi:hypothetical protein